MATQAYLIGSLQETSSILMKLIIIGLMAVLYGDPFILTTIVAASNSLRACCLELKLTFFGYGFVIVM